MKYLLQPFYRAALFLVEHIPEKWQRKRRKRMGEKLRKLYPGQERADAGQYDARCLAILLAVLFWGSGLILFGVILQEEKNQRQESLARPGYGEGSRETELMVSIEGETETERISVSIGEQVYTVGEMQQIFDQLIRQMEPVILGENTTLDEVRSDLNLPSSLYDGSVQVSWTVTPSNLLDDTGVILREPEKEGELAELKAVLKYQKQEAEYHCYARIFSKKKTQKEELMEQIRDEIQKADEEGKYEETLVLPQESDGKKLIFYEPAEHRAGLLFWIVLFLAIGIAVRENRKLEKMEKERKYQLVMDYPDILFKLSMFLGAGMTIRAAFEKTASGFEELNGKTLRYAYAEMQVTCRELENGMGEAVAYEAFGKRCEISSYVKLGSLLSQNLKKGAQGLQKLLEKEAAAGFEERKNMARKLGEEAGTKLLIPMMLMLILVLVILMVPALMSF